jgi:hypothetical protein
MRWFVLPFLSGFLACYLVASLAFGATLYASQRVEVGQAIAYGPRWPMMIGLLWGRSEWLRDRAAP